MNFDYDQIDECARAKAIRMLYDGCQLKSAISLLDAEETENTYIIGQVLKLVHHNKNEENEKSNIYTFYTRTTTGSRLRNTPTFDRMLFLTDEANPPQMFVMIFQFDEARNFFNDLQNDILIGRFVIIYEPFNKNGNCLQELPVIQSNYPCLPLKSTYISQVPTIAYREPMPGIWYYFRYKGKKLEFKSAQIVTRTSQKPPACSGVICDRQDPLVKSSGCGCFFVNKSDSIVLQVKIKMNEIPIRNEFRSLRLTRATVSSLATLSKMSSEDILCYAHKELRDAVKSLCNYINQNGGFTIVGYALRSQQKDASDQNRKIEAEQPNIHLAYVYPTNLTIVNGQEYKRYMFVLPENYAITQTTQSQTCHTTQTGHENADTEHHQPADLQHHRPDINVNQENCSVPAVEIDSSNLPLPMTNSTTPTANNIDNRLIDNQHHTQPYTVTINLHQTTASHHVEVTEPEEMQQPSKKRQREINNI